MTTITTTGALASVFAEETFRFDDANTAAYAYFFSAFGSLAPGVLEDESAVITATQVAGDDYLVKGSGFTGARGTVTHVEYSGSDGSIRMDGALSWHADTGITGGRVSYLEAHDSEGHGLILQGNLGFAGGSLTGTITRETIFVDGMTAELTGTVNSVTDTGTISSIMLQDSGGVIQLSGSYSYAAFASLFYGAETVDDVLGNSFFSSGNDTLQLTDGSRAWHGFDGLDKMTGGAEADAFYGDNGNDTLLGMAGDDILSGDAGNDTLDGGAGDDSLGGGLGNDLYLVDSAADDILENAGEGMDAIKAAADFDMQLHAANVENLTLLGTADISAAGNDLVNTLTGNAGANTLDGGGGADRLVGGAGNDVYVVGEAGDIISDTAGIDTVISVINWTLGAGLEKLELQGAGALNGTGNTLANVLTGNGFDNTLNGAAGNDTMFGGLGDDTYVVSAAGDAVIELDGGGNDTVLAAASYALGGNIEHIVLTGTGSFNATGNDLDNVLEGNSGNNTLNGMGGGDIMTGGKGNDSYVVDSHDDVLREDPGAGTDTVISSIDFALGDEFENLVLTVGGHLGIGNRLNNVLTGSSGDDALDGDDGADKMTGGLGNDTYYVDNARDTVVESANAGNDAVRAAISWTLSANVENLVLVSGAVSGKGNALANIITGNEAANTLAGGAGADTFVFRADTAFAAVDVITDFSRGQHDRIDLSDVLAGHDPLADLSQYISVSQSGLNTVIGVDAGGAGNFIPVVTLTHVSGLAAAGLDALLQDHTIIT